MIDVEQWLIDLYTPQIAGQVADGVPTPTPSVFLTIERTGGPGNRVSDRPQMTFGAYAKTQTAAVALANKARMIALALSGFHAGLIVYSSEEIGGIVKLPDPRTPLHARYVFTVSLHLRGARTV